MKIRYWIAGYTTFMLLILLYIYIAFANQPTEKRDMVYYNEQCILVTEALQQGTKTEEIEEKYECEILLCSDEAYERKLQNALQEEALLLDYFEDDALAGKTARKGFHDSYYQHCLGCKKK